MLVSSSLKGTVHPKNENCHHVFTLKWLQEFLSSVECKRKCFENVGNQTVAEYGSQ